MKLIKIFEKLGKQPLHIAQKKDAVVIIGDKEYPITGIKYKSGQIVGFIAVKKCCSTCKNNVEFPPPHTCDICTSLDEEDCCMWEENR